MHYRIKDDQKYFFSYSICFSFLKWFSTFFFSLKSMRINITFVSVRSVRRNWLMFVKKFKKTFQFKRFPLFPSHMQFYLPNSFKILNIQIRKALVKCERIFLELDRYITLIISHLSPQINIVNHIVSNLLVCKYFKLKKYSLQWNHVLLELAKRLYFSFVFCYWFPWSFVLFSNDSL